MLPSSPLIRIGLLTLDPFSQKVTSLSVCEPLAGTERRTGEGVRSSSNPFSSLLSVCVSRSIVSQASSTLLREKGYKPGNVFSSCVCPSFLCRAFASGSSNHRIILCLISPLDCNRDTWSESTNHLALKLAKTRNRLSCKRRNNIQDLGSYITVNTDITKTDHNETRMTVQTNEEKDHQDHVSIESIRTIYSSCFT